MNYVSHRVVIILDEKYITKDIVWIQIPAWKVPRQRALSNSVIIGGNLLFYIIETFKMFSVFKHEEQNSLYLVTYIW